MPRAPGPRVPSPLVDMILRAARYARIRLGRRPALDVFDVARMSLRVWPSDLDELRHMNNGVYPSTMDLPRYDLLHRAGLLSTYLAEGIYPVVVAQTVSYRRSLKLWQRYDVETRLLGFDDRAVYLEQRFVVDGEIFARGYIAGRFLRRSGGVVSNAELGELSGIDPAEHPVPDWMHDWARAVALPSTRSPAPSVWSE
jgi:acyl-CoA thioesterase FadM